MPIYEYRCSDCGFESEVLQKVNEPAPSRCPACGKESLRKLVSAAGFQLRGSGWYATDFKNSGAKPAENKPEAKSGAKDEAKVETKTESKTEAAPAGGQACTTN